MYGLLNGSGDEGVRQLDKSDALDRFLAGVERRAYRMAAIATSSRDDALDIVQDAMLKLAGKYSDRSPEEWGPLFHCILQTTIKDWYRRQAVRRKWNAFLSFSGFKHAEDGDDENAFENVAERSTDEPDEQMALEQSMQGLQQALEHLPYRQQQVFMLRVWEGLSVKQTAQAMACSEGSVKTHYFRALQSLQTSLKDLI